MRKKLREVRAYSRLNSLWMTRAEEQEWRRTTTNEAIRAVREKIRENSRGKSERDEMGIKTGSSISGTQGITDIKANEYLGAAGSRCGTLRQRMEEAQETQIIIYSPRNDSTTLSFLSLWRAKRDWEMIRKLNKKMSKQKDTIAM